MTDPDRPPRFLLGLGCQKGGTTWVYDYLADSPDFAAGFLKELHVFSVADFPEHAWWRERLVELARSAVSDFEGGHGGTARDLHRLAMVMDGELYFDYFAALLRRTGARLSADVTPDYGKLSAGRLRSVDAGFAERGVEARALFIMRDPVDRTWSQLRMRRDRKQAADLADHADEEALLAHHARPVYERRSRYDETLAALEASFPVERTFLTFYEELFDRDEVARLCAFGGIGFHEPALDVRSNATSRAGGISPETDAVVTEHYAGVYRAVAERFGAERVTRAWPRAARVL